MMQFTEEQRKALIERINQHLSWLKKACFNMYNDHSAVQEQVDIYEIALAALTNATAPAVPDGWKLVPVEPTREMLDSSSHEMIPAVHYDSMREYSRMLRRHAWRVMLAAAPEVE